MKPNVRVIGGGFSGLVTARAFARRGFTVSVCDHSERLGGMIQSPQSSSGVYETAANGILNSTLVAEMFRDADVPLQTPPSSAKRRYIFRDHKLRQWPLSFGETVGLVFKWALSRLRKKHWPRPGENLKQWSSRVLTLSTYQFLLAPALQGIYAGNAERLSASLLLTRLFLPKPFKTKPSGTVFPLNGMEELIRGLEKYLRRQGVKIETSVEGEIKTDGAELTVIATNAPSAAKLLQPISPVAAAKLRQIEMLPLVTVQVFAANTEKKINAFGALFPRGSGLRSLGVLWDHALFPSRSQGSSERWILGGATDPDIINYTDQQLEEIVKKDRAQLPGPQEWQTSVITRWPQALPHYTTDLEETLNQLVLPPKVALIGNYTGSIGLAQILVAAEKLADQWEAQYGR